MIYATVEDLESSVEVVCFPKVVLERGPLIRDDAVLVVKGRVDHRGDDVKVIALDLSEPSLSQEEAVRIRIKASLVSDGAVERLKKVVADHPGETPVYVHLEGDSGTTVVRLGEQHCVEARAALYADLRSLLGPDAVLR